MAGGFEVDYPALAHSHAGADLIGRIATPHGEGKHPAVLVMHDARGMGQTPLRRISELASMGYVGFAADMYGGGEFLGEKGGGAHMVTLHGDPELFRARVLACFEALMSRPEVDPKRIAAIGYCFGGQCVLELARSGADVKLAISYHGLLTTKLPAQPGAVKAQIALFNGGKDPYVPAKDIAAFETEMAAAGARWHATLYSDAFHAFTDPDAHEMVASGVAYNALADRLSWAATKILLEETLGV